MSGCARSRPGFATAVVILVVIVLSVAVFSYFTSLRQRRFLQFKQVHGEIAYGLARVATDIGRTQLSAAIRVPDSKLFKSLTRPLGELTPDSSGRIVLDSIDVLADYRGMVEEVLKAQDSPADMVSRLGVTFFLRPALVGPFEEVKAGAVSLISPREKQGKLFVEASCVVSGGLLAETEQKLLGQVEFRVTQPAMPLLSDFTLFLGEPPRGADSTRINVIEADSQGVPSGGKCVLVLANGEAKPRGEWEGKLDAAALAKQGWVYVGGDAPLLLNLTFGSQEDALTGSAAAESIGEDFHFFQEDPAKPRVLRAYPDRDANQRIGNDPFWEIRYWDIGVPDNFGGGYLPTIAPAFQLYDHHQLHASLLHLYGRPTAVSPTLVFGRVESGFLRLAAAAPRGQAGSAARVAFCLLKGLAPGTSMDGWFYELEVLMAPGAGAIPEAALESEAGQAKSGKLIFLNPNDRTLRPISSPRVTPEVYREIQSRLMRRSYNASLQFLSTGGKEPFPQERGIALGLPPRTFVADSPDAAPAAIPASEGPHTVPGPAWPRELAARGALDLRQVVPVMGDERLSTGRASRRLPRPASGSAVDALTRAGMLRGKTLELGGVVEIGGPVSLPAGLEVARGGVLVADDIALEGEIKSLDPDQPLLLVARKGGVRVETPAKIAASLAAPLGAVSLAGTCEVQGQVVARTLDLDRVESSPKPTLVSYDPGLKGGADGAAGARRFQIDVSKNFTQVR